MKISKMKKMIPFLVLCISLTSCGMPSPEKQKTKESILTIDEQLVPSANPKEGWKKYETERKRK